MKYDAVVIGGGLGGLECGYILARQGLGVLVLERGRQTGGCMQSYRRGGRTFDTGFHYVGGLGCGQSLHAAFEYLGLLDLPWHRLDAGGFDLVTVEGRTFAFAQGYDNFVRLLAEDFPAERPALERYANLLRQTSEGGFDVLGPRAGEAAAAVSSLMEVGAWQYLNENFRDPLLVSVLSGTSLKMELRKESLPLFTFLHGNGGFIESSWRLRGDGSMIARKLAEGIRGQGGEIICGAEVRSLEEKDGKAVRAVCAGGEKYEGGVFISSLHPAATCRLLEGSETVRPSYRGRICSLENTFGMFTASISFPPETLPYSNFNRYIYRTRDVWDFHRTKDRTGGVLLSFRVPEDGGRYARQADLITPMAWDRCATWSGTRAGRRGADYKEMKKRVAGECLELAAGFLPAAAEGRNVYTSTPLTWRDYTLTPEGSAYGVRKDFRNPLLTMLSPRTPLKNLFQTGQSLMLHGVHGVTMTAFYTCAEILGREAVWKMVGRK